MSDPVVGGLQKVLSQLTDPWGLGRCCRRHRRGPWCIWPPIRVRRWDIHSRLCSGGSCPAQSRSCLFAASPTKRQSLRTHQGY
jgi:hypothetical protein